MANIQMHVNWAALMADGPLGKIADFLLENQEYMDTYAALRQVCPDWRRGLEKPDLHLHNWIKLDHALPDVAEFTFLNLATRRYVTIDLTEVHHRYYFIGFYRGVIVLAQKNVPHKIRVLNPLTKKWNTMFEAQMPSVIVASVAVTKSPTMVFVCTGHPVEIAWVDESTPTKDNNEDFGEGSFSTGNLLLCITPFHGELYALDADNGDIVSTNIQLEQRARIVNMYQTISGPEFEEIRGSYKFYLVESDGDLLLVLGGDFAEGQPVVYRVDMENRSLHAVSNIGSRALFVNFNRSISVDTRVHPTLRPGCIYYTDLGNNREYNADMKAWYELPIHVERLGRYGLEDEQRPYRLEDLLAAHCRREEFNEYFMEGMVVLADEIYGAE